MYIPTQFFGQGNRCLVTSGGQQVITSINSGSLVRTHVFTTPGSASYQISTGSNYHKILMVGAGGSGGWSRNYNYAAGGGGGDVVYLENILLTSGSYNLYVGLGGIPVAVSTSASLATNGEPSWFQYEYPISNFLPYTFLTSSLFLSPGGGAGGYINGRGGAPSTGIVGQNGACGGGGVVWGDGSGPLFRVRSGVALYNPNYVQGLGFNGVPTSSVDNTNRGTGGGGASTSGSIGSTTGGNGYSINFTGLGNLNFSYGGNGREDGAAPAPVNASGSGGSGISNADTFANSNGKNGLVMLQYNVCADELNDCTTYVIRGGALGGNLTYMPCGTATLLSSSISPNFTGSVCVKDITGYPSGSGTITLIATGSCDNFIPIPITPLCSGSQVQTPTYLYNFTFLRQCYPTPTFCQDILGLGGTITYTNAAGTAVTESYDLGSRGGQICAREFPAPTIQCATGPYAYGDCGITKTNVICGYYCSGSI